MKISEIFKLNRNQRELDFVDIDFPNDVPLFLNPFLIKDSKTEMGLRCEDCIASFFELVISYLRVGNKIAAFELMSKLGEVNEVHLGVSTGVSRGNGIGPGNSNDLINSILRSEAVKSGVVEKLEDFRLFIDGIGIDKVSDLIANVIRYELIKYTQKQCDLWGIKMQPNVKTGFYWDSIKKKWEQGIERMLVINDSIVLLVPKEFVAFTKTDATNVYYHHFVLEFFQNDYIRTDHYLVKERKNKKTGEITKYVNKKDIDEDFKKQNISINKAWLSKFSEEHPEILQKYRNEAVLLETNPFEKVTPGELNFLADSIIAELNEIQTGEIDAVKYQKTVCAACELLFYPALSNPEIETNIQGKLKRIDITFSNRASTGFFKRIVDVNDIPAHLIMMECKNYSDDIGNPEFDQLTGRFSNNRGKIGFLFCRHLKNEAKMIEREKAQWKENNELVIHIDDSRLIKLLINFKDTFDDSYEELLSNWMDEIIRS